MLLRAYAQKNNPEKKAGGSQIAPWLIKTIINLIFSDPNALDNISSDDIDGAVADGILDISDNQINHSNL